MQRPVFIWGQGKQVKAGHLACFVRLLALAILFTGPSAGLAGDSLTGGKLAAEKEPGFAYPAARRLDLVEDHFGTKVLDPWRWLENDLRDDAEVRDWVAAETRLTDNYLSTLPGRKILGRRMARLYDYGRFSTPRKAGSRYFFTYNRGLQNQSPLYVREGLYGPQRLLLDPNSLSDNGTVALAEWAASSDGRYLAYALQDRGSDWRTLHVLDVSSGEVMSDRIDWVKFSNLSWDAQGQGFFYSRFPAPDEIGRAHV